MLLSQTSLYALRAMIELAYSYGELPVRSAELAEKTYVPPHYLSKIMRKLVKHGRVSAQKGHRGGFQLASAPEQITFLDILHAMDLETEEIPCAFGWEQCGSSNPCPLHDYWQQLNQNFLTWAEETTLADVLHNSPGYNAGFFAPALHSEAKR